VAPTSIAVDASGNVAIVGFFLGVLDAGGGARNAVADEDVFVVKLDAAGHHLWSAAFGGTLDDAAAAVAFDAAGDVLVTGYFSTTINFGGNALTSAGGHDVFVTKLRGADGSHGWSHRFGDMADQNGSSIAVDFASNVLVTGDFAGTTDLGGGALASAGGRDIFVAKLDPSGGHVWAKRFGDAADQWGASVATDAAGAVVITGALMGQADFGGPEGPIASVGGQDVFAAKLDPNGGYLWAKRFGDTADQWGAGAAFMGTGSTVISGVFQGTMELGGGVQLTSTGTPGVFVAAFGP
jgi:hypothetical protein